MICDRLCHQSPIRPTAQKGNILFLILIAVVLFGALTYATTSSLRGGGSDISSERSKAIASEIMNYAISIKTAIMRLQLAHGCQDEQISFDNPNDPVGRYNNLNAPVDKRCHVFDLSGGGIVWKKMPPSIYYDSNYGSAHFVTGDAAPIKNFGTDEKQDIYLSIQIGAANHTTAIKRDVFIPVCKAINNMNGISTNVPYSGFYNGAINKFFTGSFDDNSTSNTTGILFASYPIFCAYQSETSVFKIIAPLLTR